MVEAFGKVGIQFTMTLDNDKPKRVTMRNTLCVCQNRPVVFSQLEPQS